ncbi:MAG: hypothetical protein V4650_00690 [Pseudomonadota bacterium]
MRRCLWLSLSLAITGCASAPVESPFVGFFAPYKDCRAKYADIDARIDAAGVRDGGYYRVPGFPYLRSERLLASFRGEVESPEQLFGMLRRLRELDQEAREFEYINLGMARQEAANLRFQLLECGRALAMIELDDPKALRRMMESSSPPDDYSDKARLLGLHSLTAPALRERVLEQDARLKARFAQPLPAGTPTVLWQAATPTDPATIPRNFGATLPDELGFPGLTDSGWTALAERNAPALWMETASASDAPGAPAWVGDKAMADPQQPFVNFHVSFARFGGQIYGQIVYFYWFQHEEGLDGLIWRVTLDAEFQPVVYESLRASGAEHLWFPVQALARRETDASQDPPHFPQAGQVPKAVALRLASGSQRLDRVVGAAEVQAPKVQQYELRRYEDLFMLPRADGGFRSLFGPDGLARNSASTDPVWRYASGIRHPGVARQYGRHAIDYVGRSHFDDPRLLERVFVAPRPLTAAMPASGG